MPEIWKKQWPQDLKRSIFILIPKKSNAKECSSYYTIALISHTSSPWGHEELDTTKELPFQFLLSCIGEGNGNLLQCSCLENPRNGGAWWAAVYGVT